jgi:hypothetical protein
MEIKLATNKEVSFRIPSSVSASDVVKKSSETAIVCVCVLYMGEGETRMKQKRKGAADDDGKRTK